MIDDQCCEEQKYCLRLVDGDDDDDDDDDDDHHHYYHYYHYNQYLYFPYVTTNRNNC